MPLEPIGVLRGSLSPAGSVHGVLTGHGRLSGEINSPRMVLLDYAKAENKPAINEHILRAGENTLSEIGIGVCNIDDIDSMFA